MDGFCVERGPENAVQGTRESESISLPSILIFSPSFLSPTYDIHPCCTPSLIGSHSLTNPIYHTPSFSHSSSICLFWLCFKVHSLLARKYGDGSLTDPMIVTALTGYGTPLDALFEALLGLAQGMLSSGRLGPIAVHSQVNHRLPPYL